MNIEEIRKNAPDGALYYDEQYDVVWYFKYNDVGMTLIHKGQYWQLCVPDIHHDIKEYAPIY